MAAQREQHYGLADPASLEKIDRLFACGVGDHINLPQIVVVGDQSSGKSSVLEGLIRKPLPRDSGLCTRFATQIIFKRSPIETISISIIPGADAAEEHKARLHAWSKRDLQTLDSATFASIMVEVRRARLIGKELICRQVHDTMGLSRHQEGSARKGPTFSRDVLRLEICGPTQEHLSVIDVPGIFKNTTPGITTKDDISLVRSMVLGYMENPRSVMLAVVPANVDVATQEILELAADVDPEGKRTLGVLTKPDLVDQGAESRVVDLLQGRAHPLRLGWHVVRNPGQQQLSDVTLDRGKLEQEFFDTRSPWNKVEKDKVGIESLRVRIQDILSDLVRQEFPKVRSWPYFVTRLC
jgi:GTPase SAR1 family protein